MNDNLSKRVALRIPSGWIVHYNELYDEEPILEDGSINPRYNDSEDLIWLEQLDFESLTKHVVAVCKHNNRLSKEELKITQDVWLKDRSNINNINIDVGWYGGNAIDGIYRLVIYRGNWDNIVNTFECKSTLEITEHLNYCLENIWE